MEGFIPGQEGSAEIVFFDIETTVPNRVGQRFWVLEFGAVVVCSKNLVELESYSTLIKPKDLSSVALRSARCDGITRDAVANAPAFEDVADKIFSLLNGVLTEKFRKRAGNMKMASLATYFGLGKQKHRSLDDVRMNLEVLKHCATVLFLESSLPAILNGSWKSTPTITTRSRSGKSTCREETSRKSPSLHKGKFGTGDRKNEESIT
ncbi:Protein NEN4 [Hibiscus syriacus]|uniref:Protein NEN4 n=1 Tax=Hibiscus syriacus TaxID=106335 RepID=A0A6A2WSW6_HIBSY|nr:Protein NEN4 [Hibiscus syriacus]